MAIPYRKILVPLDGSDLSDQALPHAQQLATQVGATLVLLQVVPNLS
jgi:nucleotide-binding universal stress UspA family protein